MRINEFTYIYTHSAEILIQSNPSRGQRKLPTIPNPLECGRTLVAGLLKGPHQNGLNWNGLTVYGAKPKRSHLLTLIAYNSNTCESRKLAARLGRILALGFWQTTCRVKWGNVGQKRAWSFSRLCTQFNWHLAVHQLIQNVCHIFTYQLLILYANKCTALTWFKVWICKTERTSKLENPTSAVGVKSDNYMG